MRGFSFRLSQAWVIPGLLAFLACGGKTSSTATGTGVVAGVPRASVSVQQSAVAVNLGEPVFLTPVIQGGAARLVVRGGQFGDFSTLGSGLKPAVDGAVQSGQTYVGFPNGATEYRFEAINSAGQVTTQTITVPVSNMVVSVVPSVAEVLGGQTTNFGAVVTGAVDNGVTWSVDGAGSVDSGGKYTAPVGVAGAFKVIATSTVDPTRSAYGLAAVRQVAVGVSPTMTTLHPGWQATLSATVVGTLSRGVTWTTTGGTIQGTGSVVTYVAPDAPGDYKVSVASQDDPRQSADVLVTVLALPTAKLKADQELIPRGGSTTLRVSCSGGSATIDHEVGTVQDGGAYVVSPGATTPYTLTVKSPIGALVSSTATVAIEGLSVAISPQSAVLSVSGSTCATTTRVFQGLVSGATDTSMSWTTTGGTFDPATGIYTAPAIPGDYTLTVASVAVPSKTASASIHVVACPSPSFWATPIALNPGQSSTLMAVFADDQVGVVDKGVGPVASGRGVVVTPTATTAYTLKATNAAGDSNSAAATVDVTAVQVTVTPASLSLCYGAGQPVVFVGRVLHALNGTSTGIYWTASAGYIDQNGIWLPPQQNGTYLITATSIADPSRYANVVVTIHDCVTIQISPTTATTQEGGQVAFSATVDGSADMGVLWEASVGTVDASGLYTAPPGPGQAGTYQVTARSKADTTKTATATVVVTPAARSISVMPTTVTLDHGATQSFSAAISGLVNTQVIWSCTGGTITPGGVFTAPATGSGPIIVTARSVADSSLQASVPVALNPTMVSLTPSSISLWQGTSQQFTAAVSGNTNLSVVFAVDGVVGGNATVGTVSTGGLYTAPVSGMGSHTLTATSVGDPGVVGSSIITVLQPVSVVPSPGSVSMDHGATVVFTAVVTGSTGDTSVTWSASIGTMNPTTGVYTAPMSGTGPAVITARSNGDPSKSATVLVGLNPINISLVPGAASITQGGTLQFAVSITGIVNPSLVFAVDGVVGGNAVVGTISPTGLYTAPVASTGMRVISVWPASDPTKVASSIVTVNAPVTVTVAPQLITIDHGVVQPFTASVGGTTGDTSATWSASAGVIDPTTGVFTAPAAGAGPITITATSNLDGTRKGTATVTLNPVVASLSPGSVTLYQSGSQQFVASVSGAVNQAVSFAVDGIPGGNASVGQVDGTGLYTAPATGTGNHTLTVASVSDPSSTASSAITVLQVVAVGVNPSVVTLDHGASQSFSAVVTGSTGDPSVTWSTSGGTIDPSTGAFVAPAAGAGPVVVTARSNGDPSKVATATVNLNSISVTASPVSVTLGQGGGQLFTAVVGGAVDHSVTYEVDGVVGGNAAIGTVDASGHYTAPAATTGAHTLVVRSVSDPTQFTSCSITVNAAIAVSVSPSAITLDHGAAQAFTATVTGTTGDQTVSWSASAGVIDVATGAFVAPAAGSGPITITARSNQDGSTVGTSTVTLNPVVVTLSPSTVTILQGTTTPFTATVAGAVNQAVTFQVDGISGGNAVVGTVDASGVYTAPATGTGPHTLTATSVSDPSASTTSTVTVNQPIAVAVSPANPSMDHGASQVFSASVTGTASDLSVTWFASAGTINHTTGAFTAPSSASTGSVTITARSNADNATVGTTTVTLNPMGVTLDTTALALALNGTHTFTASVSGSANSAVVWYVDGVLWGNASVGIIAPDGSFTATAGGTHVVTAASVMDSTVVASATVTVN